jgi:3'(2'), 5'-bisphosphate nucleotidase
MRIINDLEQKVDRKAVCDALKRSGDILRDNQNDPKWRCVLDDYKLKTVADLAMNAMISDDLRTLSPGIPIFSEEGEHFIADRPDIYWLIDPVDGTASWLNGFTGYVTQIALIAFKRPVFGAIYHPSSHRLWHGGFGRCVYCNEKKVTWPELMEPPWRIIDNYHKPQGLAAAMRGALEIGDYIECGSLGLKTILTLVGEAEIFVKSTRFRDWDMAPALALVASSNGKIMDSTGAIVEVGKTIEFTNGLIVSSRREIASWAIDYMERHKLLNKYRDSNAS